MSEHKAQGDGKRDVWLLLVYLGLGLCSGAIWMNTANLPALPGWHRDMITGCAPAPNQYRPLTPWLAEGVRLALPGQDLFLSYMLLRGIVTGLALFAFDRYLRLWFAPSAAAAGALALAAMIPFTYYRVVQESDPINLLVFTLGFWTVAERRDPQLIPLMLIGTLNREATAMIPAIYLLARWRVDPVRKVLLWTALLAAVWAAVYFGLIGIYNWRQYYCEKVMWPRNVASAFPTLQVVLVYGAMWALAALGARQGPTMLRRALWLVPPYVALHYVVAMVNEVRLFLPLAPIIIPLSWFVLFPESRLASDKAKRRR